MAAEDSFHTGKTSTNDAIFFDSFIRISATGRIIAAESLPEDFPGKPVVKRQGFLVETDEGENKALKHNLFILLAVKDPTRTIAFFPLSVKGFRAIVEKSLSKCFLSLECKNPL